MNHYQTLKISPDAPDEVIRAAYKVLASKYHPDKNPGNSDAAQKMQDINVAYRILSDPSTRSQYDKNLHTEKERVNQEQQKEVDKRITIICKNCNCKIRILEKVAANRTTYQITCPKCRQDPFAEPITPEKAPPGPSKSVIDCKHCGQSIRVLSEAINHPDNFEVICPSCNRDPILRDNDKQHPPKKPSTPGTAFNPIIQLGVGIAMAITIISAVIKVNQDKPTANHQDQYPLPTQAPTPVQPIENIPPTPKALPLPNTGDNITRYSDGVAPLTIKTASGGNHFFIKIISTQTNQEIGVYFIRSGETLEILVPLGSYEIKYASGQQWYGPTSLFGPDTIYNKADSIFNFYFDGNQYSGYTVELITQRNGNLRTSRLQPGQW